MTLCPPLRAQCVTPSARPSPGMIGARSRAIAALVAGATLPAAAQSRFLTVLGQFQATAQVPPSNSVNAFLPLTQPGPGSNQAAVGTFVTSDIGYSFAETPGRSVLDVTFAHNCSYTIGGSSAFTYSDGRFTSSGGTSYTIGGLYTVPPGQHPTDLHLDVNLIAIPGGSVFHHATVRTLPGGSSIVVGVPVPGDTFTGSPTGVLATGVSYMLALSIYTTNTNFGAGGVTSTGEVSVTLVAPCYVNCDASTTPPALNIVDFACFLNRYASGDSYANCDASTTPPVLNVLDFACFLNQYAAGCP
jgi:hypothetical protein